MAFKKFFIHEMEKARKEPITLRGSVRNLVGHVMHLFYVVT